MHAKTQVQLQLDDLMSAQEAFSTQLRAQEAHAAKLWGQLRAQVCVSVCVASYIVWCVCGMHWLQLGCLSFVTSLFSTQTHTQVQVQQTQINEQRQQQTQQQTQQQQTASPKAPASELSQLRSSLASEELSALVNTRLSDILSASLPVHIDTKLSDLVTATLPIHVDSKLPDLVASKAPALVVAHVGPVAQKLNSAAHKTMEEVRKGARAAREEVCVCCCVRLYVCCVCV